jgi:hypothetical protein
MGTRSLLWAVMALFFLITSCATAPGRIYTNITRPLTTDFNNTRIGTKKAVLEEHSIKEPVSGYGLTFEWSSYQINQVAQKAGITRIGFIEEQTKSYVFGLYSHRTLIIYGD